MPSSSTPCAAPSVASATWKKPRPYLSHAAASPGASTPNSAKGLENTLLELLAAITAIRDRTKIQSDFIAESRQQLGSPSGVSLDQGALLVDFEFIAWALHHLTKILVRLEPPQPLVVHFIIIFTYYTILRSPFFQRKTTGAAFLSALPGWIRALSAATAVTRRCRRQVRAI